jgi:hypothetical protein
MLLSKVLRMQQDLEDKKNEIIIEGLESKIKDYEFSLEKKDFLLQATEGSLVELQTEKCQINQGASPGSRKFKEKLRMLRARETRTASKMQSRS